MAERADRGVDPNDWVMINDDVLLDGVFGMQQSYFIEYVIKRKGSTALVDENSVVIEARPDELDLPEIKKGLLRAHQVDPQLYYCHISKVSSLSSNS